MVHDAAGAQPDLDVVCTLHEQAAAIAAETYTKASGRLALCLVTTGPGGTNAVTSVAGAWLDWMTVLIAIDIAVVMALAVYLARQSVRARPLRATGMLPFGFYLAPAIWLGWMIEATLLGR